MAHVAIAGAVEFVRPQLHRPGPVLDARAGVHVPPSLRRAQGMRSVTREYLATIASLIAEDETVDEEEALERLWRDGGVSQEPSTLVNGTSPVICALIDGGWWMWADASAGTLRRRRPAHVPVAQSRFRPTPSDPASADVRRELRELRRAVLGDPSRPFVTLAEGHALVLNPHGWPIEARVADSSRQIAFAPGEVVELDDLTADMVTRSGVLRRISTDELAEMLAG